MITAGFATGTAPSTPRSSWRERKAQRLASKLQDDLLPWAREHHQTIPDVRTVVSFVQESVFLHHPGLRCALPIMGEIDLYGIDGNESRSGLPGSSERLLEPALSQQAIGAKQDQIIAHRPPEHPATRRGGGAPLRCRHSLAATARRPGMETLMCDASRPPG